MSPLEGPLKMQPPVVPTGKLRLKEVVPAAPPPAPPPRALPPHPVLPAPGRSPMGNPLKEFFLSRELTASIQPRGLKGEHHLNALQMFFLPFLATARRAWSGGGHSTIQAAFCVPPANFLKL